MSLFMIHLMAKKTSDNICDCNCTNNLETSVKNCQETNAKDMGDKMAEKAPFTRAFNQF